MWGGVKVGTRRLVVVTGASSGLGLWAAKALADKGDYFVICAVRDPSKMDKAAKEIGMSKNNYLAMKLELGSFQSVKDFVDNLKSFTIARPAINHLICNAAVPQRKRGSHTAHGLPRHPQRPTPSTVLTPH